MQIWNLTFDLLEKISAGLWIAGAPLLLTLLIYYQWTQRSRTWRLRKWRTTSEPKEEPSSQTGPEPSMGQRHGPAWSSLLKEKNMSPCMIGNEMSGWAVVVGTSLQSCLMKLNESTPRSTSALPRVGALENVSFVLSHPKKEESVQLETSMICGTARHGTSHYSTIMYWVHPSTLN